MTFAEKKKKTFEISWGIWSASKPADCFVQFLDAVNIRRWYILILRSLILKKKWINYFRSHYPTRCCRKNVRMLFMNEKKRKKQRNIRSRFASKRPILQFVTPCCQQTTRVYCHDDWRMRTFPAYFPDASRDFLLRMLVVFRDVAKCTMLNRRRR